MATFSWPAMPAGPNKRRIFGLSLIDLYGELATTVALSHNIVDYKAAYDPHHDVETFTMDDPDTAIVLRLRHYGWSLVNPVAYTRDLPGGYGPTWSPPAPRERRWQ